MRNLYKTLAVLTLAATGLGLAQAAQAGDRLTIIYSNGGYHALPSLYLKQRPAVPLFYGHGDRYGYAHSHYNHPPKAHKYGHHRRDEHRYGRDDRWSRAGHGDGRHEQTRRHDDRHDNRGNRSAYAKGDRY